MRALLSELRGLSFFLLPVFLSYCFFFNQTAFAEELIIEGQHYALVKQNWSGTNHQSGGAVKVGGYIRSPINTSHDYELLGYFDVSDLQAASLDGEVSTADILSVSLRFRISSTSLGLNRTIELFEADIAPWDPNTVVYDDFNNTPFTSIGWQNKLSEFEVSSDELVWGELQSEALTSLVKQWASDPNSNQGIVLAANFAFFDFFVEIEAIELVVNVVPAAIEAVTTTPDQSGNTYTHAINFTEEAQEDGSLETMATLSSEDQDGFMYTATLDSESFVEVIEALESNNPEVINTLPEVTKTDVNGTSITITQDALPDDLSISEITFEPIALPPPPAGVEEPDFSGEAFEFEPDGTTFNEPVKMTIPYDPDQDNGLDLVLYIRSSENDPWELVEAEVDYENHTVTGFVNHFSTGRVGGRASTPDNYKDALHLDLSKNLPFDTDYTRIRARFLDDFFFNGAVAAEREENGSDVTLTFGDHTVYLGFALLTFAGEARVLRDAGFPEEAEKSESILRKILDEVKLLDRFANGLDGYFIRDLVYRVNSLNSLARTHTKVDLKIPPNYELHSDFRRANNTLDPNRNSGQNDMSQDQALHLFMGFWSVKKWLPGTDMAQSASQSMTRILNFMRRERFYLTIPNSDTPVGANSGEDGLGAAAQATAGFFHEIADRDIDGATFRVDADPLFPGFYKNYRAEIGSVILYSFDVSIAPGDLFGSIEPFHNRIVGYANANESFNFINLANFFTEAVCAIPNVITSAINRLPSGAANFFDLSCSSLLEDAFDSAGIEIPFPNFPLFKELRKGFVRNLVILATAFEDDIETDAFFKMANEPLFLLPTHPGFKGHVFAKLIRTLAADTSYDSRDLYADAQSYIEAVPVNGPNSQRAGNPIWFKDNRWIRHAEASTSSPGTDYNGLDYLGLEVLMHMKSPAVQKVFYDLFSRRMRASEFQQYANSDPAAVRAALVVGESQPIYSRGGKCLDVDSLDFQNQTNGGLVQTFQCSGGDHQKWTLLTSGEIQSENGLCLEVDGTAFQNQVNEGLVQLVQCHGDNNQKWSFSANGSIVSQNGKCLEIRSEELLINRGHVQVSQCNGAVYQKWTLDLNESKLNQIYLDILEHHITEAEFNSSVTQLSQGVTLGGVRTTVAFSDDARDRIKILYFSLIGRFATDDEITAHAFELRNITLQQVRENVAVSSKAQDALDQVYDNILNRAADTNELNNYIAAVTTGSTIHQIQQQVANSTESQNRLDQTYQQVLDRNINSSELTTHVAALGNGSKTADQIRHDIATSDEAEVLLNATFPNGFQTYSPGLANGLFTIFDVRVDAAGLTIVNVAHSNNFQFPLLDAVRTALIDRYTEGDLNYTAFFDIVKQAYIDESARRVMGILSNILLQGEMGPSLSDGDITTLYRIFYGSTYIPTPNEFALARDAYAINQSTLDVENAIRDYVGSFVSNVVTNIQLDSTYLSNTRIQELYEKYYHEGYQPTEQERDLAQEAWSQNHHIEEVDQAIGIYTFERIMGTLHLVL